MRSISPPCHGRGLTCVTVHYFYARRALMADMFDRIRNLHRPALAFLQLGAIERSGPNENPIVLSWRAFLRGARVPRRRERIPCGRKRFRRQNVRFETSPTGRHTPSVSSDARVGALFVFPVVASDVIMRPSAPFNCYRHVGHLA